MSDQLEDVLPNRDHPFGIGFSSAVVLDVELQPQLRMHRLQREEDVPEVLSRWVVSIFAVLIVGEVRGEALDSS